MSHVAIRHDVLLPARAQHADVAAAIYGDDAALAEVRGRYTGSLGWWGYFAKTALSWRDVNTINSTIKRER